ncbi:hypothetical protein AZH43_14140 [Acinetobacter pragensis]|uniref:Uncharacterized protein n=1 Tax=Acinetobacter pragensis TaxID=1806892 RepID=A0A151Y0C2_9GAMM|nr:hypothetical protein AZH43_14140 [Acinetobacter pragensis]
MQAKRANHAAAKRHEDSCKCYISEIYLIPVQFIPRFFIQISRQQLTRSISAIMICLLAYIASRF